MQIISLKKPYAPKNTCTRHTLTPLPHDPRNKLEIKKEKGEKFENNVGMTIFLLKYLEL
jgi:hypothetical protein